MWPSQHFKSIWTFLRLTIFLCCFGAMLSWKSFLIHQQSQYQLIVNKINNDSSTLCTEISSRLKDFTQGHKNGEYTYHWRQSKKIEKNSDKNHRFWIIYDTFPITSDRWLNVRDFTLYVSLGSLRIIKPEKWYLELWNHPIYFTYKAHPL